MRHPRSARPPRTVAGVLTIAAAILAPASASAQAVGNVCVRDFQPGAVCTANDVRIQALNLVTLFESCDAGVPGEAEARFEMFVSSVGSPERYDIGLFVGLGGGSARDGDACLHDFLEPPLTPTPTYGDVNSDGIPDLNSGPWLLADTDACGDIAAGSQLFKQTPIIRVACVDTNGNGIVDASVCTSWDNNAITNCATLNDAFPGTNAKCGCARVELGIPMGIASPTPPPSTPPSVPPSTPPSSPTPPPVPGVPDALLAGLAVLLAAAGYLVLRRRPAQG